jgi:hypothetical protein
MTTTARVFVDEVEEESHRSFGRELLGGIQAGQVAGLAMAATLMVLLSVFTNKGLFYPLQVIAASVLGENAIGRFDARTLLVGVAVHQLGPALAWGVVFGVVVWLFKPQRSVALMMWGLLVGAVAQIVDVHVLLPLLSGELSGRLPYFSPLQHENLWAHHVPVVASWLAHLMFGLGLSLYPWRYDPAARSFD